MTVNIPYMDDAVADVRDWASKYKTKFNEDPTVFSVYGYQVIDYFIQVADKAGPNLTTDSFIKAMDCVSFPPDMFGAPPFTFSADQAAGQRCVAPVADHRWQVEGDFGLRQALMPCA